MVDAEGLERYEHRVQELQIGFMKNNAEEKLSIELSKVELSTFPNRRMVKQYEKNFSNDKEVKEVQFQTRQEFEMAKYSHFPEVRKKCFQALSDSSKGNTDIVLELIKLRTHAAMGIFKEENYFSKQLKQQTIKINGSFEKKIKKILDIIRPQTLKDIEVIKRLTGEPDVHYYDFSFLKEKVKAALL